MNIDIRLNLDFFAHPKTKKLRKRVGLEGIFGLQLIWVWAAANRPTGLLVGLDAEDIELIADWDGEDGQLVQTLVDLRFIDTTADGYAIHDWEDHQTYASKTGERGDKARFSRLATVNKAAYEKLKAEGVNAISKEDYEKLTSAYGQNDEKTTNFDDIVTTVDESLTNRLTNRQRFVTPRTKIQEPIDKNIMSSPIGKDIHAEEAAAEEKQSQEQSEDHASCPSRGDPPCPYEKIKTMYHNALPENPRVALLNDKRKQALKARWHDVGRRLRDLSRPDGMDERLAYFERFFATAASSDFLTGKVQARDGRTYFVDFDKLISPSGWLGVVEGKYANREVG